MLYRDKQMAIEELENCLGRIRVCVLSRVVAINKFLASRAQQQAPEATDPPDEPAEEESGLPVEEGKSTEKPPPPPGVATA